MAAEDRVLDALCGPNASEETRLRFRHKLRAGELNEREIEIEVADSGAPDAVRGARPARRARSA